MLKVPSKFVIFGHARSGSSTLKTIFAEQDVKIIGEPFNHDVIEYYSNKLKNNKAEDVLDELMDNYDAFKHLCHQANIACNKLILNKYKTIFIYRKDLFKAAISSQLALKTGVWSVEDVGYRDNYHNVESLDVNGIRNTFLEFKNHINMYKKFANQAFFVTYEDLYESEHKLEIVNKIFKYVNVKIKNKESIDNLLSKNHKLNKQEWCDVFKNWDEIQALKEELNA